jgi:hypothetical protein
LTYHLFHNRIQENALRSCSLGENNGMHHYPSIPPSAAVLFRVFEPFLRVVPVNRTRKYVFPTILVDFILGFFEFIFKSSRWGTKAVTSRYKKYGISTVNEFVIWGNK